MSDLVELAADFTRLPHLPDGVFTAPLQRPPHVGEDWLEPRQTDYSADDHRVWDDLFARQMQVLPGRAATAFLKGLDRLDLGRGGVPDFARLSAELGALTGWSVVPVPMLIPDHVFFWHLANRRFPAGNFIRSRECFDYIEEPDVFHDVFGHVPMLTDPVFADYMQEYGRAGWKAMRYNRLKALGALYWYTVEFGLMRQADGLRIYGAGIVSSYTETCFSVEDASPNRLRFDLARVMRTRYRIDDFQESYFVIHHLDELLELARIDFAPWYERVAGQADLEPGDVIEADRVYTRGTGRYHAAKREAGKTAGR